MMMPPQMRQRSQQDANGEEAPLQQQIQWGKQMTGRDADPEAILALCYAECHRFSPRNLATAAHRIGKFGGSRRGRDPRLPRLAQMCKLRVRDFEAMAIANTVWGFAKTTLRDDLFEVFATEVLRRGLTDFDSQNIANTAWAFAKAQVVILALFQAIASETVRRIVDFNSQALANTAWAFATAEVGAPDMFEAIAFETIRRIKEFNAQALANTAWVFAKIGYTDADDDRKQVFYIIGAEVPSQISAFSSQNMANTARAFSPAGV